MKRMHWAIFRTKIDYGCQLIAHRSLENWIPYNEGIKIYTAALRTSPIESNNHGFKETNYWFKPIEQKWESYKSRLLENKKNMYRRMTNCPPWKINNTKNRREDSSWNLIKSKKSTQIDSSRKTGILALQKFLKVKLYRKHQYIQHIFLPLNLHWKNWTQFMIWQHNYERRENKWDWKVPTQSTVVGNEKT